MFTEKKQTGWYVGKLLLLIVCALFLATQIIYWYIVDPQRFPINTIKIVASYQHITQVQLKSLLEEYNNFSFFSFPVAKLHAALSALEWTHYVQVRRIWPDGLKIKLIEKIPVAIWNDSLLTKDGELFNKGVKLLNESLPHLSGPLDQPQEALQIYEKMSSILTTYGLYAITLEWRNNEAWELTLSNGVRLRLGKRDLELRINRFCKAYHAIFKDKSDQLISVDLRYPRGMAVQWKK